MAGALARAVGYAQGGDVDDDEAGSGYAPDVTAAPDVAPGTGRGAPSDSEGALAALGPALIGSPEEVKGAFARNQQSYDAAKQRQIDLIRAARARIPSANGGIDPQLAAAAAMGSTHGPYGAGLAEAFGAYNEAKQRQYQNELQNAQEQGRYDIDEGTAGVQGAEGDFGFLKEQLGLGERAAQASDIIQQRANVLAERAQRDREIAQRDAELKAYRDAQLGQKGDLAEQGRWQAGEGIDPTDPTGQRRVPGMYQLPRQLGEQPVFYPGQTLTGVGGAGRISVYEQKKTDLANALGISTGEAALRMTQKGITPEFYEKALADETNSLRVAGKPNAKGQYQAWSSDELARQADANVTQRITNSLRATGTLAPSPTVPFAGPDTTGIAFPGGPGAAPAASARPAYAAPAAPARPAPAAPAAQPAAGSAQPATGASSWVGKLRPLTPAGVPPNAQWSRSQGKFWWQEGGKWKSASPG
jgi:hypothetical protein